MARLPKNAYNTVDVPTPLVYTRVNDAVIYPCRNTIDNARSLFQKLGKHRGETGIAWTKKASLFLPSPPREPFLRNVGLYSPRSISQQKPAASIGGDRCCSRGRSLQCQTSPSHHNAALFIRTPSLPTQAGSTPPRPRSQQKSASIDGARCCSHASGHYNAKHHSLITKPPYLL